MASASGAGDKLVMAEHALSGAVEFLPGLADTVSGVAAAVTFRAGIELGFVALGFLVPCFGRGQRRGGHVRFGVERLEHGLDLRIALGDERLVL